MLNQGAINVNSQHCLRVEGPGYANGHSPSIAADVQAALVAEPLPL